MEWRRLVIRPEQRRIATFVYRAEDMIVDQEMVVAEQLGRLPDPAKRLGIAAQLDLRIDNSQLHPALLVIGPASSLPPAPAQCHRPAMFDKDPRFSATTPADPAMAPALNLNISLILGS